MNRNLDQGSPEQHLYESLITQAQGGSWTKGFQSREISEDPWDLGIFNPEVVHFDAPDSQKDRVEELKGMLFGIVRPFFIQDEPWAKTVDVYQTVMTNSDVVKFAAERGANLISITPHTMFADLGLTAGAAYEVMDQLDPEHPFGGNDDPRNRQTIVAGRILSLLKQKDFGSLTDDLPIMEGLMLPLAGVTTTHSANGSSMHSKKILSERFGDHFVRDMNARTTQEMEKRMTRGGHVFHKALHGSQAKWDQSGYTTTRIMVEPSQGTRRIVIGHNQGDEATHKNMVMGLAFDCPSIGPNGVIEAQNAGVAVVPEVWVPTKPSDIDIIMRALALVSNRYKQSGLPEFRYLNPHDNPSLSRGELKRLSEITLTDLRD